MQAQPARSLIPSTPPRRAAWAWGSRSAVRSFRPTEGGYGPAPKLDQGRCFTLLCPRDLTSKSMRDSHGFSPIIAIVDDDPSVREGLSSLLRSAGWSTESFGSAQEFLSRSRAQTPSCLILD